MSTINIAFYKGKGQFVDWVIRFFTNSIYSHCELLFPDGRMFSSDAWHGGTRFINIDQYFVQNWDIVTLDITEKELKLLMEWCEYKQNKDYDWYGVVAFILPFMTEDQNKWFCSELCAEGLKFINRLDQQIKTHKLSPGELHKILVGEP